MSGPDETPPPRPKRPKTTEVDQGWRAPTEPDEPTLTRPKVGKKREPAPATGGPKMIERVLFGRVSTTHLASFCRQFATYTDASGLIDDDDTKQYPLTLESMKAGLAVFQEKAPHQFKAFMEENEDALTGDCFLQCCLLGEVVYG